MAGNSNLQMSRAGKTDEFYTQLSTIESELDHYREYFRGKTVFCNCDDPYESNFFKYFAVHFNEFGLKKLMATCYAASQIAYTQFPGPAGSLTAAPGHGEKRPYRIVIRAVAEDSCRGNMDSSEVEALLENPENTLSLLRGDGDFRSEECLALLRECDVVVTNPPFSLMKEYIPLLIRMDKQFIILGNLNHITFREVKPFVLQGKMWLGYHSGHFWFRVPDSYEEKGTDYRQDESGGKWRRMGNSCWFTNVDIPKRHIPLQLYAAYDPQKYPRYDDYEAIECGTYRAIPADYEGVIGVPITYLPYHCPEQFEVIELVTPKINGKSKYKRLLIQRKSGKKENRIT